MMRVLGDRLVRVFGALLLLPGSLELAACDGPAPSPPPSRVMTTTQAATPCTLQQGSGLICGARGDSSMLYGFVNRVLTPLMYCANGCNVLPPRDGVRQDECRGLSDRP